MIVCDLCGEGKDCLQKEIEGRECDICAECWKPLAQKLGGKAERRIGKPCSCRRDRPKRGKMNPLRCDLEEPRKSEVRRIG
jgi:hypothetical protein